jgi:DNA-binding CsgD family transcriptional regulator
LGVPAVYGVEPAARRRLCLYEDRRIFGVVAVLRHADLQGALDFLREAEGVTGPDPFPSHLLDRFRELVPCEFVWYCELDRPGGRMLFHEGCARVREVDAVAAEEEDRTFWRLKHQHPLCVHQARAGDFTAHKLSDFVSRRQLHRLEIYAEFLQPNGVEYELELGLPAPPWHTKVFGFDSGSHDFGEHDRLLLDLLRPHLVSLYESAKMRRLAAALAAGAEASGELVMLDSAARIEFATVSARRLLRDYCGDAAGARLPQALEDWFVQDRRRLNGDSLPSRGKPLAIEREHRRLVVTRMNGDNRALLLVEELVAAADPKLLSWREWQVLGLVEEGKSNAEIAAGLWIAPGTVRTHLENIYAKLGVHNRTAALARARELNSPRRSLQPGARNKGVKSLHSGRFPRARPYMVPRFL